MEDVLDPIVSCKTIPWLSLVQPAILIGGSFICLMVAYANNSTSIYFPFFSETGAHPPEVCIFSYTLILGSFLGVVIVLHRYVVLKHILIKENRRLLKLNKAALCFGLLSMAGLAGVAAIPMSTVLWAHHVAAAFHFLFAVIFMFMHTYISYCTTRHYSKWNVFRIGLCVCIVAFLICLIILFPISHKQWRKDNSKPPALKLPGDKGFAMLLASALFEWLLYLDFILFIFTFLFEFHNFNIEITVVPIET